MEEENVGISFELKGELKKGERKGQGEYVKEDN
jgi:hypothetical protein